MYFSLSASPFKKNYFMRKGNLSRSYLKIDIATESL